MKPYTSDPRIKYACVSYLSQKYKPLMDMMEQTKKYINDYIIAMTPSIIEITLPFLKMINPMVDSSFVTPDFTQGVINSELIKDTLIYDYNYFESQNHLEWDRKFFKISHGSLPKMMINIRSLIKYKDPDENINYDIELQKVAKEGPNLWGTDFGHWFPIPIETPDPRIGKIADEEKKQSIMRDYIKTKKHELSVMTSETHKDSKQVNIMSYDDGQFDFENKLYIDRPHDQQLCHFSVIWPKTANLLDRLKYYIIKFEYIMLTKKIKNLISEVIFRTSHILDDSKIESDKMIINEIYKAFSIKYQDSIVDEHANAIDFKTKLNVIEFEPNDIVMMKVRKLYTNIEGAQEDSKMYQISEPYIDTVIIPVDTWLPYLENTMCVKNSHDRSDLINDAMKPTLPESNIDAKLLMEESARADESKPFAERLKKKLEAKTDTVEIKY